MLGRFALFIDHKVLPLKAAQNLRFDLFSLLGSDSMETDKLCQSSAYFFCYEEVCLCILRPTKLNCNVHGLTVEVPLRVAVLKVTQDRGYISHSVVFADKTA